MEYRPYSKEKSEEAIKKLVDQFDADFNGNKNPKMKEAQLEDKYLKPLFSFLNWNIHNEGIDRGREEFRVQTSHKIKSITKEPDYELWLPDKKAKQMKRVLFMEAKDPKYDLSKETRHIRQAYQYAHSSLCLSDHSSKRTNLSILTDFEEFRLFDCSNPYPLTKDEAALFNKQIVKDFDLKYPDYVNNFDSIWEAFERNNAHSGSLKEFMVSENELQKNRKAPDLRFLNDLKEWRLEFSCSMLKSNKNVSDAFLTSASQLILNRIIFLKMLTDREIEKDYLSQMLDRISREDVELSIYDSCRDIFKKLETKYNGDIFKRREEFDHVKIENKVIESVLKSLRPEKSIYTFSAMPTEIIGSAYEQFLGEVIVRKKHKLLSENKPDAKKADGVYYTPRYIVDYIVENSVGELLKNCRTPEDVEKLKILDPACGSGTFLIGAYDYLLQWHITYYKNEIDNMLEQGISEIGIKKKFRNDVRYYPESSTDGNQKYFVRLTSKLKKNILVNNIFGVDIDYNAVEISKFSLSMKSLENSARDELCEDIDLFNERILPSLDRNIKDGNSLIGTDFINNQQMILFDEEKVKMISAFDWNSEFSDIIQNGGFDAVIGNPPYDVLEKNRMSEFTPHASLRNYVKSNDEYAPALGGKLNLFRFFVVKFIRLTKITGRFGLIIPLFGQSAGVGPRELSEVTNKRLQKPA